MVKFRTGSTTNNKTTGWSDLLACNLAQLSNVAESDLPVGWQEDDYMVVWMGNLWSSQHHGPITLRAPRGMYIIFFRHYAQPTPTQARGFFVILIDGRKGCCGPGSVPQEYEVRWAIFPVGCVDVFWIPLSALTLSVVDRRRAHSASKMSAAVISSDSGTRQPGVD